MSLSGVASYIGGLPGDVLQRHWRGWVTTADQCLWPQAGDNTGLPFSLTRDRFCSNFSWEAGIELFFFPVARVVLCFGFNLRTVPITH